MLDLQKISKNIIASLMKARNCKRKLFRYGLVGCGAAGVHGCVLIILSTLFPLWFSNLFAFLLASLASYLGHSLYTFQQETQGNYFARRWLVIQFSSNIFISTFLPLAIDGFLQRYIVNSILIITPTILNFLIWKKAAHFSAKRRINFTQTIPQLHADDLGLTRATNQAILSLTSSGILDSASLIINGNSVKPAIKAWQENPQFTLFHHLCLTEGKATAESNEVKKITDKKGRLNLTFLKYLAISCLPKYSIYKHKIYNQLKKEVISQVSSFKQKTGLDQVLLDGHQHIHLVPIVLDVILELSTTLNITWIRTTNEPIPSGFSLKQWKNILLKGGFFKWIILQTLDTFAKPRLLKHGIKTNASFSGILLSGRMSEKTILCCLNKLMTSSQNKYETNPMILIHPAKKILREEEDYLYNFPFSKNFLKSPWRQDEYQAIKLAKKKITQDHKLSE